MSDKKLNYKLVTCEKLAVYAYLNLFYEKFYVFIGLEFLY